MRIAGNRVNELPARSRNLAMVFQDYALYPNMTVAANIGFGLRMNRVPAAQRAVRVAEIAELLQLGPYLERKPRALSGGQRQRVAMGRALARKAQLFLFDEPLSNLDAKLRLEVRTQIKLLHRALGMTSVFVTHDQTEAMTLADRIVCLDAGRIAQIGTPEDLYNAPRNLFVASFIGSPQINLLDAVVTGAGGGPAARLSDGQTLALPPDRAPGTRPACHARHPAGGSDRREPAALAFPSPQPLAMDFLVAETLGSDTYLVGEIAGARVQARCAPVTRPEAGTRVTVHADAARLHLFDPGTGLRL